MVTYDLKWKKCPTVGGEWRSFFGTGAAPPKLFEPPDEDMSNYLEKNVSTASEDSTLYHTQEHVLYYFIGVWEDKQWSKGI